MSGDGFPYRGDPEGNDLFGKLARLPVLWRVLIVVVSLGVLAAVILVA